MALDPRAKYLKARVAAYQTKWEGPHHPSVPTPAAARHLESAALLPIRFALAHIPSTFTATSHPTPPPFPSPTSRRIYFPFPHLPRLIPSPILIPPLSLLPPCLHCRPAIVESRPSPVTFLRFFPSSPSTSTASLNPQPRRDVCYTYLHRRRPTSPAPAASPTASGSSRYDRRTEASWSPAVPPRPTRQEDGYIQPHGGVANFHLPSGSSHHTVVPFAGGKGRT